MCPICKRGMRVAGRCNSQEQQIAWCIFQFDRSSVEDGRLLETSCFCDLHDIIAIGLVSSENLCLQLR